MGRLAPILLCGRCQQRVSHVHHHDQTDDLWRALSHQPFLLIVTCPAARIELSKFNGLASQQNASREPFLARCDSAPRATGATTFVFCVLWLRRPLRAHPSISEQRRWSQSSTNRSYGPLGGTGCLLPTSTGRLFCRIENCRSPQHLDMATGMGFRGPRNGPKKSSLLRCLLPTHDKTARPTRLC